MAKAIFCIANCESQAEQIVCQLKDAGFADNDISALFPDKTGTKDFAHEQHTKAPEGAVTGASALGMVGGAWGGWAGSGALAIPGVGLFIAAGPVMTALSGAAVGATVGGIAGALVGMGIPEYVAQRYHGKIQAGNILISVHSECPKKAATAKKIFADVGADDIAITTEAEVPEARVSAH